MKRLLACVLLFSLIIAVPFVSAEYEDLRTPEERGEGDFYGYAFTWCASCDHSASAEQTKLRAIEHAKNKGRWFCKKIEARGVEFSSVEANQIPSSFNWEFTASVYAKCVFDER